MFDHVRVALGFCPDADCSMPVAERFPPAQLASLAPPRRSRRIEMRSEVKSQPGMGHTWTTERVPALADTRRGKEGYR